MERNSIVTDAKIDWLVGKGYVTRQIEGGKTSYIVTEKGKEYLND